MFKVLLLNDDYTTMDFVIEILEERVPQAACRGVPDHDGGAHPGKGLCGIYPHEVAETKVASVIERARSNGFPLLAAMEPE